MVAGAVGGDQGGEGGLSFIFDCRLPEKWRGLRVATALRLEVVWGGNPEELAQNYWSNLLAALESAVGRILTLSFFLCLASPEGGMAGVKKPLVLPAQIPSPHPSRLGGAREQGQCQDAPTAQGIAINSLTFAFSWLSFNRYCYWLSEKRTKA